MIKLVAISVTETPNHVADDTKFSAIDRLEDFFINGNMYHSRDEELMEQIYFHQNEANACYENLITWQNQYKVLFDKYTETFNRLSDTNLFDIVIVINPNDNLALINLLLERTKANIIGFRYIYLIQSDPVKYITGYFNIPANRFPFSVNTVSYYHGRSERNYWYLEQLLKLYAGFVVPGILDRYLVLDSDTFFIKKTKFFENEKFLYNYDRKLDLPSLEHMNKLHESFITTNELSSGVTHNIVFELQYINEIMNLVENKHNDYFYNIFLKNVNELYYNSTGASIYDIYLNYMMFYYPTKLKFRDLNWIESTRLLLHSNYDYIRYYWVHATSLTTHETVCSKIDSMGSRLGNQIFKNLAISLLATKFDLCVEYTSREQIESLGISLYTNGKNMYNSYKRLTDDNYFEVYHGLTLDSNLHSDDAFFQSKEISVFLHNYLNSDDVKANIISKNPYKDRYNTNNDVYVHVRLGDVEKLNPGVQYYLKVLSMIEFDNLYLSSDSVDHTIIQDIIEIYPQTKVLQHDEVSTIQFASTCRNIILSHGTFSGIIGYLAFYSTIYYPTHRRSNKKWFEDNFILGWNEVIYES